MGNASLLQFNCFVLYGTAKNDLKIITHSHSPLSEDNAFRQVGKRIPVSVTPNTVIVSRASKVPPLGVIQKNPNLSSVTQLRDPNVLKFSTFFSKKQNAPRPGRWSNARVPLLPVSGEAPPYQGNDRDGYLMGLDDLDGFFKRLIPIRRILPIKPPQKPQIHPPLSKFKSPKISGAAGVSGLYDVDTDPGVDGEYGVQGLGSWVSKAVKTVKRETKKIVKKPLVALAKAPTATFRLITDPIGGKTAQVAKKIQNVTVGATTGAVTGFVTSGFNPVGLLVGGAAGTAKGIDEATQTSKAGDASKILKQSAVYGAGAGALTYAATTAIAKLNAAKAAAAAKAENIALFAGKSGYVPGASAATKSMTAGLLGGAGKVAGTVGKGVLYGGALSMVGGMLSKNGAPPEVVDAIQNIDPNAPLDDETRRLIEEQLRNVQTNPDAYGLDAQALQNYLSQILGGSGGGSPGYQETSPYATELQPESAGLFSNKNLMLMAGGGLLLMFALRRPRTRAA